MTEQNEQPMDEFVDDPLAQTETNDEIARLTAERDELRDKWMRALADAENSRKRAENPETRALASAGAAAHGSTLYCTLEPCCHEGRTSPCAPRIADAGVAQIVVDPFHPGVELHGLDCRRVQGPVPALLIWPAPIVCTSRYVSPSPVNGKG